MPELPEVETTRRHLHDALAGDRIRHVDVRRARMVRRQPRPRDFAERLTGRTVERVRRKGKVLIADAPPFLWIMHLGMSGRMQLAAPDEPEPAHANVLTAFDSGTELRFVDPRTFGYAMALTPEEYEASPLAAHGPDALDELPRSAELVRRLGGRSAPIKALLLDQHILSGLGNIYVDEILWRGGIAPHRPGGSLSADEVKALRAAVRPVLRHGLRWGGTSLDDLAYLLPDGSTGEFTDRLRAYGRDGEPCHRCGTTLRRDVIRARSAHWCPGCQQ